MGLPVPGKPLQFRTCPWHWTLDIGTDRRLLDVVAKVIKTTKNPFKLLDVTTLSEYQKDAHTSVYSIRQGKFSHQSKRLIQLHMLIVSTGVFLECLIHRMSSYIPILFSHPDMEFYQFYTFVLICSLHLEQKASPATYVLYMIKRI
ncbi:PMR5N domain-containing protein [Forsythia ovata]|uniref:PMR5N domain-containing protein n=1 Tax=Forsythia ovata TaxID=205694 RepID=A0ABD1WAS1_9LAMI